MRNLLYLLWLATLAVGVFCITLFLKGLMRDNRTGQPDIAVDLSSAASAASHDFRVWSAGEYDLMLSSVNHMPPFNIPFSGKLELTVSGADGSVLSQRIVDSSSAHMRPDNMSWTVLDSVRLERSLGRKSRLTARVLQPDPQFAGVTTSAHLRRRQYDPGMGGLVNYVMLFPGIVLLAVSFATALSIFHRDGGTKPLWITMIAALILGALGVALR
jgi:hypothetical protein